MATNKIQVKIKQKKFKKQKKIPVYFSTNPVSLCYTAEDEEIFQL